MTQGPAMTSIVVTKGCTSALACCWRPFSARPGPRASVQSSTDLPLSRSHADSHPTHTLPILCILYRQFSFISSYLYFSVAAPAMCFVPVAWSCAITDGHRSARREERSRGEGGARGEREEPRRGREEPGERRGAGREGGRSPERGGERGREEPGREGGRSPERGEEPGREGGRGPERGGEPGREEERSQGERERGGEPGREEERSRGERERGAGEREEELRNMCQIIPMEATAEVSAFVCKYTGPCHTPGLWITYGESESCAVCEI